jgi:pimeloyl-ACP methyl ester carboxylesterase
VDAPPVQYTMANGGYSVAYSVTGNGRPLLFPGPALGGMALLWRFFPEWMSGLAARFQLIQCDLRGHGMSERGLPDDFAGDADAIHAVLNRLHIDRFTLFGLGGVGHLAIRLAAANPERVDALILNGATATVPMPSFYSGVGAENWDFFLQSQAPRSLSAEESRLWFESLRESTTYQDWRIRGRFASQSNVEKELARLEVPTLVLHPRGLLAVPSEGATKLAAMIQGARLMMIDGDRWLGDPSEGLAAIDLFLSGLSDAPGSKEALASHGLSAREVEVLPARGGGEEQSADRRRAGN